MSTEKVSVISLGCPKNLVDSEIILGSLEKEGYSIIVDVEEATTVIVNTCGFIESAKEESVEKILRMVELKRAGRLRRLVVAGCLSERYRGELARALPEADLFVGVHQFSLLGKLLRQGRKGQYFQVGEPIYGGVSPRVLSTPSHYAYVRVAEGCSLRCSFCVIPAIRGAFVSRPLGDIKEEVERLSSQGVKEVVLVAQDTSGYGRDLGDGLRLSRLLQELVEIDGIVWIRLLYLYPPHLSHELIDTIASEKKVVKYLDLPLQHVERSVLRRMGRPGGYRQLLSFCHSLRERLPGVALRTAFIVVFPGETDKEFCRLLDFVNEAQFDALGAFKYSREEGTRAYAFKNQLPESLKEERYRSLMELQAGISLKNNRRLVGTWQEVMVDGVSEHKSGRWVGRLKSQAPEIDSVVYLKGRNLKAGEIVKARIDSAAPYHLTGRLGWPGQASSGEGKAKSS